MKKLLVVLYPLCFTTACKSKDNASPPSTLLAATQGTGPVQWVDTRTLSYEAVDAKPLSEAQINRLRALQKIFAQVDDSSLEKWIDDFRQDQNPDGEIAVFEAIAKAYVSYCERHSLTTAAKRDVHHILLVRSSASEAEALAHLQLKVLSLEDAKEVMHEYTKPAKPLKIGPPKASVGGSSR